MKQQQLITRSRPKLKNQLWLWLLAAIIAISIHHVHSLFVEPNVSIFRHLAFSFLLLIMPFTLFIPAKRIMGILWIFIGIPIFYHAIAGHFAPLLFDNMLPPATETAVGNLIGGATLFVSGSLSAFTPRPHHKSHA